MILDRCTGAKVLDNDFSFNSGWGIALWRSSDNLISQNKCDWCVRGYSHGVYDRGQDSAGILLFEQCSRNTIFRNSATHSGDGFFLYAGEETLKRTGKGGCNDNLVVWNDFSHAVANAIEATFSTRNRFLGNRCDHSNYGIWAGYSYDCLFEGNSIAGNRIAGIAIEHGNGHKIRINTFRSNARGIQLWWDDDKELLATKFGTTHSCRSEDYDIAGNTFSLDAVAYEFRDTSNVRIRGDHLDEVATALVKKGKCEEIVVSPEEPDIFGTKIEDEMPKHRDVFLPADFPRGMQHIMIGTWGPIDPTTNYVYPERPIWWGAVNMRIGGGPDEVEFRVVDGDVEVTQGDGKLMAKPRAPGTYPFTLSIRWGAETIERKGMIVAAPWTVRHWKWKVDPRKEWSVPADAEKSTHDRLAFAWGSNGPDGVRDGFATYATTSMKLPAGRYRIRTVSDDGIRVRVNGKTVIDDWTHHAPRRHAAVLELEAGTHKIEVDHFELDGWATLQLQVEPVR